MSGFRLPPDISSEKRRLADGWAYIFRHRTLGMLGRLLIQDVTGGRAHLSCEVAGDPADPMTAERGRIFKPLGLALAEQLETSIGAVEPGIPITPPPPSHDPGAWIETKLMACPHCGAPAAALYFVPDATDPGRLEDYARMIYPDCAQRGLPAWLIGGETPLPGRPARILAIWPERQPVEIMAPASFNARLSRITAAHCPKSAGTKPVRRKPPRAPQGPNRSPGRRTA